MKPTVECNTCHKQGDGHWAGWHKKNIHDTTFALLYGEEDEPPQGFMDIGSGDILTSSALAKRFKSIRRLWSGDWSIYPARGSLSNRRNFILMDI